MKININYFNKIQDAQFNFMVDLLRKCAIAKYLFIPIFYQLIHFGIIKRRITQNFYHPKTCKWTKKKVLVIILCSIQYLIFFYSFISLIAHYLEIFFKELSNNIASYKYRKPKPVNLSNVSRHISSRINYLRSPKSIYDYIRLRRSHPCMNPIKVFRNAN